MVNKIVNNSVIIEGVFLSKLTQVKDGRGAVMHHLNFKSPTFKGFEESYISKSMPKVIKAWKLHKKMTQNFCVPVGAFKVVIFDNRTESKTYREFNEFILDENEQYSLLTIPPGVYYGFQCLSQYPGIIVNITNLLHDPAEVERIDVENEIIAYKWDLL
jgi:dTDP-4-dehydrorhamnose 3,5-epimerase